VLLDGATTAEKGDKEDDTSHNHQEHRSVEKRVTQKVQVVAVDALDHAASDDQCQSSDLQKLRESKNLVKVAC
jgi:hypothetical protein